MDQQDVERIARAVLKEFGVHAGDVSVAAALGEPGSWRIDVKGGSGPSPLKIRCGQGSTAQWVRQQIFDQFTS